MVLLPADSELAVLAVVIDSFVTCAPLKYSDVTISSEGTEPLAKNETRYSPAAGRFTALLETDMVVPAVAAVCVIG